MSTLFNLIYTVVFLGLLAIIVLNVFSPCIEYAMKDVAVTEYKWRTTLEQASETPDDLHYDDHWISIDFEPQIERGRFIGKYDLDDDPQFAAFMWIKYALTNKRDQALKILWDESSMILPDGRTSQVVPGEVRCIKAGLRESLLPTVIPPHSKTSGNMIFPVAILENLCDLSPQKLDPDGSKITLYLALSSGDKSRGLNFGFRFERIEISHTETQKQCVRRKRLWDILFER